MIYPGYMLNPGDMFQVDPERVLFAIGAPKTTGEAHGARQRRRQEKDSSENVSSTPETATTEEHTQQSAGAGGEASVDISSLSTSDSATPTSNDPVADLVARAREVFTMTNEQELSAKRKQALRSLK